MVCSIGGNVAENSGGVHCLKYGVTSNHVLGLEVVLPDGTITQLGNGLAESSELDLRGAFIGSEGTLGIATAITLRLLRGSGVRERAVGGFRHDGSGRGRGAIGHCERPPAGGDGNHGQRHHQRRQ